MTRKVFEEDRIFPEKDLEKELSQKLSGYDCLRLKNKKEDKIVYLEKDKPIFYELKIRDTLYKVPKTINEIRDLLLRVIEAKEDPEGFIECNGQKYSCSPVQEEYLDRFLFFTYQSHIVI